MNREEFLDQEDLASFYFLFNLVCGLGEVTCPYQARALIFKIGVIIGIIMLLSYLPDRLLRLIR